MRKLVIIGAGAHGRVTADAAVADGWRVAGFLDDDRRLRHPVGRTPVLGGMDLLEDRAFVLHHEFIVAVGSCTERRRLADSVDLHRGSWSNVVHPGATVSTGAKLGHGIMIAAGVVVNTGATIGNHSILNTGATVDHDNVVGDFVHIGPGAHLAGAVRVERGAEIGTGAVAIPRITIGEWAVVGAGIGIISDVPARTMVAGCPAERKKSVNQSA